VNKILWVFILFIGWNATINSQTTDSLWTINISGIEIAESDLYQIDNISISRSQFLTTPASFDDPARILKNYPGIINENDQANQINYRFMPSYLNRWEMYGARIVNPNHLSNAGTVADLPNPTAGGTNMISGQTIGQLNFYGSPSENSLNSVGSTLDMSLRKPYKTSLTTNLSLIGLEAGYDKIFNNKSAGFINYRYSTVGLLTQLGLDFGGEQITYQDLTASFHTKSDSYGDISTYLTLGLNSNIKDAIGNDEVAEEIKDLRSIDYNSIAVIAGLHQQKSSGNRQAFNTLNFSFKNLEREGQFLDANPFFFGYANESMIISSTHQYKVNQEKGHVLFVLEPEYISKDISYEFPNATGNSTDDLNYSQGYFNVLPAVEYVKNISPILDFQTRIGSHFSTLSNKVNFVGNVQFGIQKGDFSNTYSVSRSVNEVKDALLYFVDQEQVSSLAFETNLRYKDFGITGFAHFNQNPNFAQNYHEVYENYIPYTGDIDQLKSRSLSVDDAEFKGVSVYGAYTLGGVKLSSNYTIAEVSTPSEDAFKYSFNFGLNKNWPLGKGKVLGTFATFHSRTGGIAGVVDINNSLDWGYTNYESSQVLEYFADYQRLDFRIFYKKERANGGSSVISLDIQNLLSKLNDAYFYYEPLINNSKLKQQLGAIPIISWRVTW